MFADMDRGFAQYRGMEFQNDRSRTIWTCFVRFDAIFSLNQDLFIERHYLNGNVGLGGLRHWNGWQMPGTRIIGTPDPFDVGRTRRTPEPSQFRVERDLQPFFKLHGSSNWVDQEGGELLVLGGNKPDTIAQHPILGFYFEQFAEYLNRPDTRLMVIGYGFADEHINRALTEAASRGLRVFLVDPLGISVLRVNRGGAIPGPQPLLDALEPRLIGWSQRALREIFGTDYVGHAAAMRFFD